MGLDIAVFTNIKKCADDEAAFWFPDLDKNPQSDGLSGAYTGEEADSFRAGSYSGYNAFRDTLSVILQGEKDHHAWSRVANEGYTKPFDLLINFSDCDGVIGPTSSKKLAQAFEDHLEDWTEFTKNDEDGEYLLDKYLKWMAAFQTAGDNNGCILFI